MVHIKRKTVFFSLLQETYQKFRANPPARIKRKAEKERLEKEEAKRLRETEEQPNQSAIDPTTGQFIPPPPQQSTPPGGGAPPPGGGPLQQQQPPSTGGPPGGGPPLNGGGDNPMLNGGIKENGDANEHHNDEDNIGK